MAGGVIAAGLFASWRRDGVRVARLADMEKELKELEANTQHWPPKTHERILELRCQIAVEKWLDTFGPTDRERD